MKAIKNITSLSETLCKENTEWQKQVYQHTGVIPVPNTSRKDITLFSSCGYIDLDADASYSYKAGQDVTDYCEITTVRGLIDYILMMDSYKACLLDVPLGSFSKSELFWGIWSTIINPLENQQRPDGCILQDWGLYQIQLYDKHIDLHIALVNYNDGSIWIDCEEDTTINEALQMVVNEMNVITEDIEDIPPYQVFFNKLQDPPKSFEELYEKIAPGGEFSWL